jgi:hypothetical protein
VSARRPQFKRTKAETSLRTVNPHFFYKYSECSSSTRKECFTCD